MLNPDQLHDQLSALAKAMAWPLGHGSQLQHGFVCAGRPRQAHQLKGAQRSAVTVRVWNSDGRVGITSRSDL